jgi:hypothetical protein
MTGFLRMLLASTLAGVALVASGCGQRQEEVRTIGETEGIYVDVGGLRYQVQNSRILNPNDPEDAQYLIGVPESEEPGPEETWFGIFLRVANTTSGETHETAEEFEIVDTQGNVYEPLEIDPEINPWVYEPTTLGPQEILPEPDSAAANGPTRGALLLFKPTLQALQNRPLELEIHSPEDPNEVGIIDLDV